MLEQILEEINNWFERDIIPGTYTIQEGNIALPFLQNGQYFRIVGSLFNDGLYRYGPEMEYLQDETFTGAIWALAIPKKVIELAAEVTNWQEKYGDIVNSPYTSESFAGYSYTKSGGANINENSGAGGWRSAFRSNLKQYRKLRWI